MSTNRGFDADHRRVDDGYDDSGRDDGRTERLRTGDDARDERLYERDRRYEDDRVAGEGRYAVDDPEYHDDRLDAGAARFGGVKFGSAFFGWLAAMGLAVLLIAIVAAAGTAVGLETGTDAGEAVSRATDQPETVGMVGAIAIAVILFVSYYAGGFVAGRMARFDGAKQGFAVWLWAIIVAIVVAVVGAVAGSKYDILGNLNSFPRIPVNTDNLTSTGVVALVVALVIALVGAVLGGLAGMRFHRRVDRAVIGA